MKIAFPIDANGSLSPHFGRCVAFLVLDVAQNQILGRQLRINAQAAHHHSHESGHAHPHGHDHHAFVTLLGDCQVVIALGMGPGARRALEQGGLDVVLLDSPCEPDAAALRHVQGTLLPGSGTFTRSEYGRP